MTDQLTLFPIPKQEISEHSSQPTGKARLLQACRSQTSVRMCCLDDLIPIDHQARRIWAYVENLDLSRVLNKIKSVEFNAGRPAVDPKILVTLWLYATIEGIGSAHVLSRYTKEHSAFKWICGDVKIERRTISQFRTDHGDLFDDLLAQGVAILVKANLVTLAEIAQDGLRVRAFAGRGSFRKEKRIDELYANAKERILTLKKELEEEPNKCTNRQKANKLRAAEDQMRRLKSAKAEFQQFVDQTNLARKRNKKKLMTNEEISKVKISSTDAEARIMKMPDEGFRPAYNFQFAVDTGTNIIVATNVVNAGTDGGQMLPMYEKLKEKYTRIPDRYLADGGFKSKSDITTMTQECCVIYVPVQARGRGKKSTNQFIPKPSESKEVGEWRIRMGKEESQTVYKRRGSSVELANANARHRGLYQLCVRGLEKAKSIASMFAIAHNVMRTLTLGIA